MVDMSNPQTFWLNVTNIGLGLVTLACVVVLMRAVFQEVISRKKVRVREFEGDDHTFRVPALGLTMADGGVRVDRERRAVHPDVHADEAEPNIYRSVN